MVAREVQACNALAVGVVLGDDTLKRVREARRR
jgi:hypothetical protein